MPPKNFVRLELVDGSLSLAAIEAEVAKRCQRNGWSAFAPKLSTFALRSFSDAMAAENVQGSEAIPHASSQVTVRTSLVQAMTSEVKRDAEAALNALRLEAKVRVSLKHSLRANGKDKDTEEQDIQSASDKVDAIQRRWMPNFDRVVRLIQEAQKASERSTRNER